MYKLYKWNIPIRAFCRPSLEHKKNQFLNKIIFIYSRYNYHIEHKLWKTFDCLYNQQHLCALYTARVNDACLPHHPAEARSRDLPVPRRALYHWATDPPPPPPPPRSLQNQSLPSCGGLRLGYVIRIPMRVIKGDWNGTVSRNNH